MSSLVTFISSDYKWKVDYAILIFLNRVSLRMVLGISHCVWLHCNFLWKQNWRHNFWYIWTTEKSCWKREKIIQYISYTDYCAPSLHHLCHSCSKEQMLCINWRLKFQEMDVVNGELWWICRVSGVKSCRRERDHEQHDCDEWFNCTEEYLVECYINMWHPNLLS